MNYMLSAEKTRQHNMQDVRWTMRDKAVAFKGILKLYKRDRKYGKTAVDVEIEVNRDRIKTLSTNLFTKKVELDQIMSGSKEMIDGVLVGHKELRLATRRSTPQMLLEAFNQNIYTCRRKLDVLFYRRKSKEETLKQLLLERMELQQIRDNFEKSALELECQKTTGKVQDRILLTEAAISVRETYKTLIALMRKDNKYYGHMLKALEVDINGQNRCQISLINLGQVATEEVDDFKTQFFQLRKVCKINLYKRINDLEEAERKFKTFADIKKHSHSSEEHQDAYFEMPPDEEYGYIMQNISNVEEFINGVRKKVGVRNYESILPCLKQQKLISEKLKEFKDKMEEDMKTMRKSVLHARAIAGQINDYDFEVYKNSVDELQNAIEKNKARVKEAKFNMKQLSKKVANIHLYLQSIEDACLIIEEETPRYTKRNTLGEAVFDASLAPEKKIVKSYQPSGILSIELISKKLNTLMQNTRSVPPTAEFYMFEAKIADKTVEDDDNILESFDHGKLDTTVPSRTDIKETAHYIVMKNVERD